MRRPTRPIVNSARFTIYIHGTHIHHLVWGILLLLIVGFCWLVEVGDGAESSSLFAGRLMSLLYGVGAALTLDELAIWLNLEEGIYWTHRDRASLDAIILFGAALLIALLGRTFAKALSAELLQTPPAPNESHAPNLNAGRESRPFSFA